MWAPGVGFFTASMSTHLDEQGNSILPALSICCEALSDILFLGNIYLYCPPRCLPGVGACTKLILLEANGTIAHNRSVDDVGPANFTTIVPPPPVCGWGGTQMETCLQLYVPMRIASPSSPSIQLGAGCHGVR